MGLQRTIKKPVKVTGIGLHSGKSVSITLRPALPGTGVQFIRTDLDCDVIQGHYLNVSSTVLATTLGKGTSGVSTVEHLMAALAGLNIDNIVIETNQSELPALDGSAHPFCEAIEKAGIQIQLLPQTLLAIRKKVELVANEKWAMVEPSSNLVIHGSIEWDHPSIGYQEYTYHHGETSFHEICNARTFGFSKDVEALRSKGLGLGGSMDNAIILSDYKILNDTGLRHPNEFVRHKILDALGDFKLAGYPILGKFRLHRAGHDMHYKLLNKIFEDASNYELIKSPVSESAVHAPGTLTPQMVANRKLVASY